MNVALDSAVSAYTARVLVASSDAGPKDEAVELSDAVRAPIVAETGAGTADPKTALISDATPIVTVPVGPLESTVGHAKIALGSTVALMRRRVGANIKVKTVVAGGPEYVAVMADVTLVERALMATSAETDAVTETGPFASRNVTGTVTEEPETRMSPVANSPSVAVVASRTTAIAELRSFFVRPSGAVTTTANLTELLLGAVEASVYWPTETECVAASYVYEAIVPYTVSVVDVSESTHVTADDRTSAAFGVVVSYPVRDKETVATAPATVPYVAPRASAEIEASADAAPGPV